MVRRLRLLIRDPGNSLVKVITEQVPYTRSCEHCVSHTWQPSWIGTDEQGDLLDPAKYMYEVEMALVLYAPNQKDPQLVQKQLADHIASTPTDVSIQAAYPRVLTCFPAAEAHDPTQPGIWMNEEPQGESLMEIRKR